MGLGLKGKTLLHRTSIDVNIPMVLRLLSANADPRIKDDNGATALIVLLRSPIMNGRSNEGYTIVKELLATHPDLSIRSDSAGDMPLHVATFVGATEVIEMLLKAAADVNVQNRLGQTALHRCCSVEAAK